jgi:hypothetical protein
MRRAKVWLAAIGLMAAAPGLASAGPFNPFSKGDDKAAKAPAQDDQSVADGISANCKDAGLARRGNDIGIEVRGGVAILSGKVMSREDALKATQVAQRSQGVRRVENRIQVAESAPAMAARRPSPVQQTSASARRGGVRPANFQGEEPADMTEMPAEVVAQPPMAPQAAPPGVMAAPYPPSPMGGPGYGMGGPQQVAYDQPNLPNHSWPTYGQYPNYAAVTYPKQYSASAWPYIGPFYPYPQVPLGWRKAQLEWDDGYWQLNFRPRTERWWWFMDYRNW